MNIVVFINPQQEINEYWNAVITNMSEDDKAGIEFALQLKEKNGGNVTAVAIGTEEADLALREAFAMGVDHAALLQDDDPSTEMTEKIEAALVRVGGDVFVSGRQDDEMKRVAERLGTAQSVCTELELENFSGQNRAFVYVTASVYPPRHMNVGGIFSAYKREIEVLPALEKVAAI
ncbi:hypothetical protein [Bacillus sp. B15-48]|uniref:hypothetical protein n=1 Tax=Bacillus sp. B15-48 TaxID=1548601 RepID=UPI00193F7559|nr:hypothetical protein [Bacillus sp. B15-48]MBM4762874.1 hypothetical protein [Bacillus sp. B15-48]